MIIAKSTLKAAGIHLCLSAAVAAIGITLLLALWYPPPYFYGQGGRELLLILLSVDVVIGPLCTLVVFDHRKHRKELIRDLGVIAVLQLSALIYGGYVTFASRPVFTVLMDNSRFVVTSARDIEPEDLAKATRPEFRSFSLVGPVIVAADPPAGVDMSRWKDRMTLTLKRMNGDNEQIQPQTYVPYSERRAQALAHAGPLEKLRRANPGKEGVLDEYLQQSGRSDDSLRYLPVLARRQAMSALIDAQTGDVLVLLPLDPNADVAEPKLP